MEYLETKTAILRLSFNILMLYFLVVFHLAYWLMYYLPDRTVSKHFLISN